MSKSYRHGQILKLIRAKKIHTQDELARELQQAGIAATQVTLSRDIRELHLVKTPEGYRDMLPEEAGPSFATLAAEFLHDVRIAQNLVVLKTSPGHANSVAVALDAEDWPEVAGTLAGDDTILVIAPDNAICQMSEGSPSPGLQTLHSPWLYVAMAIVTVMAAYSYLDGQAFRNAANSAERSRSLVAQNQQLLTLLMDTGANQTGYLLTGDARYLAAYNLALSKVSVARQVLRRPDVASPEDCVNLDSLIAAKLEDWAQTVRIRQQGDVASALQRTDRGKEATDQIRALGAHIIAHEDTRFHEHTDAALRHGYQTRIVVQLGALILFGLLWFSTRRIDRLTRAQYQIVSDLESTRQREALGSAALATTLRGAEESERRYRLLFEANPQPMWVFDRGTLAFLAVNHAAIARYGFTREEFLGMTLRDIRPPEDVPELLEHTRDSIPTPHTDGPWRHRRKDGSILVVEIACHPIQFGDAVATLVMAHDITERKRLEDELRQSQKLEAVGQLAGGIAHDFNNLLTVIEGYADMIRADQAPEDVHRESAQEILLAAQRAASLTRQLLAFSRRQILQPIRLNLNANVTSTQRMLSRLLGENIQIHTTLAPDLWDVFADPGQVDQIVLNLAVNARDAMERGGTLTIETANVEGGARLPM